MAQTPELPQNEQDRRLIAPQPRSGGRRWTDDPDIKTEHERESLAIGAMLNQLRTEQGWSLEQHARVSGVHADTLQAVENGHTDVQLSTLIRAFYPLGRRVVISVRPVGQPPATHLRKRER